MPDPANHYRDLEGMYERAACNIDLGATIAVAEGSAEVQMSIDGRMLHAADAVHSCYYFKLLDDASFYAAASLVTDAFVLAVGFNVQLLRPISSGNMRAVGKVHRLGASLIFADSVLYDERGHELARGSGVFARSKTELADVLGYD